MNALPPLRPYQASSLDEARAAINGGKQAALVVQPTGCGKTRTAVEACINHVKLGGLPMFVAPRRELISQATATLRAAGLEPGHDVFVRTIQELSMPNAEIPLATMVVLDEARHYVADAWSRLCTALPDAIRLGLDATPERGDGRGLGSMFDTLVEAITIREAIDGGYLVPVDVIRPDHALGPDQLAQDPVAAYMQYAPNTSAVCFAASVDLAKAYASAFRSVGVSVAPVWGDMPTVERDRVLRDYDEGKIQVLCNVHILTEGWDAPRTETVILAGPVATVGGLLQRTGRGMRLSPETGKKKCTVLDLRGATHLLGEPDDDRTWHLDGRAARLAVDMPNVKFCPVCGAVVATEACEQCGHAGEMRKRKPRVLGLPMDRFKRQHEMPDEEAAKALRGYMHVARSKGFKRGWAFHAFESKYGRKVTPELLRLAAG